MVSHIFSNGESDYQWGGGRVRHIYIDNVGML